MPKQLTVFYSWQSDTPSKLNRNFIEEALHEALKRLHSDATLEVALRDATVELDKDTKGVAGSPPITETILGKIGDCTAFVADFTFVGESKQGLIKPSREPRLFPNPNVLIEHGYALRCHGHTALVGVMNTAYGEPDKESLPFDLRHLRRPITYHLADSTDAGKKEQFEKLTAMLMEALRLILANRSSSKVPVAEFTPRKATKNAAVFWDDKTELIPEGPFNEEIESFKVPDEGKAYLRLYPTQSILPLQSELRAQDLVRKGNLHPMGKAFGRLSGSSEVRNELGAIAYRAPDNGMLFNLTQLFLSGEIWGVDGRCVNRNEVYLVDRSNGTRPGAIKIELVKPTLEEALDNYLTFAHQFLKLPLPLRIEVGLVGCKGHILLTGNTIGKKLLTDQLGWTEQIGSYDTPASQILASFFDLLMEKCGVEQP